MSHRLLNLARIAVVLISLGLIAFLLQQGEMDLRIRLVVLAALAYYAVRLWVMGSRARRDRAQRGGPDVGDPAGSSESSGPGAVRREAAPPPGERPGN